MPTDEPDDLHDQFLKYVAAYEEREPSTLFELLPESGISLPPPEELDEEEIGRKLWEVIHGLTLFGTFLHNTDHLSDRELYTYLWSEALREPAVLMPENAAYSCHLDPIGSGSEEDTHLFMKYYASPRERRAWLKDWPDDKLPDPERPPHDRDRRLPLAETRRDSTVT
jgi:hypothetical protein